jgi:hypothetical protein
LREFKPSDFCLDRRLFATLPNYQQTRMIYVPSDFVEGAYDQSMVLFRGQSSDYDRNTVSLLKPQGKSGLRFRDFVELVDSHAARYHVKLAGINAYAIT